MDKPSADYVWQVYLFVSFFHKGKNILCGDQSFSFIRLKFFWRKSISFYEAKAQSLFLKDQKQKNIEERSAAGSDIKEASQRL